MIDQINEILKAEGLRVKAVDIGPYRPGTDYLNVYTKGNGLILPLCNFNKKVTIRSILKRTGAWKCRWLINGQASIGTKCLKFYGEQGPEIILEEGKV